MCIATETNLVFNGIVCSTYLEIKQFLGICLLSNCKLFSFPIVRFWAYLMQVIP